MSLAGQRRRLMSLDQDSKVELKPLNEPLPKERVEVVESFADKECSWCGKVFKGTRRTWKRFCTDKCRYDYHNHWTKRLTQAARVGETKIEKKRASPRRQKQEEQRLLLEAHGIDPATGKKR